MNSCVTLLLLGSLHFVYTVEIRKDYKEEEHKAGVKCKENYNLTDEVIKDILRIDNLGPRENKCFMGCVLEEMGIINGDTYDWESHIRIMEVLKPTQSMNKIIISNCKGKVNDDRCDLAYEILSCLTVEAKKLKNIEEDKFDRLRGSIAKCEEESHMSQEAFKTLLRKKTLETRDEKCLAGCILERMGYIKGDTFDWEYHARINPLNEESSKSCKGKVNEDKCELAAEIITCLKSNN